MRLNFWGSLFVGICLLQWAACPSADTAKRLNDNNFLSEKDEEFFTRTKVIRKCVDPHWMPLEGIDSTGKHVGVIADILETLEQEIGMPIELVPTENWLQSMENLKNRKCDMVTSDTAEGEAPSYYIKTTPFMKHRNVYITRNEIPLQLDFSLITDKTIGIPKGYPTIELIEKQYGNVNFVEVEDVDEGLLMVSKGDIYAFTELLPISSYSIQKQGLTNLKVAGHLDISFPVVMAVRSDMPELVDILNNFFARLDTGTVNQYLSRWLKVEYDMQWDWNRLTKYMALTVAAMILVLYWNRRLYLLNRELDKANSELALLNETDTLTRVKNRNFINNQLPGIIKIANRNGLALGVAILDIDHFKRLNDRFGHGIGDKCLVIFADKVRDIFRRESDWTIRYGGEEFVLVCIGLTLSEFTNSLELLRKEVSTLSIPELSREGVTFTVSIGYVFFEKSPEQWNEGIIDEADDYLYRAKSSGRNKILGLDKSFPRQDC
jgi:diguanylate cyclase (GGDEF)-like protein